jgi:hypothetical protein
MSLLGSQVNKGTKKGRGEMPRPFRQLQQVRIRWWDQPPLSLGPSWSLELS